MSPLLEELDRDASRIDAFHVLTRSKLALQWSKGHTGWDDPTNLLRIEEMFKDHAKRAQDGDYHQWIDVAILAFMLWYHARKGY